AAQCRVQQQAARWAAPGPDRRRAAVAATQWSRRTRHLPAVAAMTRDQQRQWLARVKQEYAAGNLTATARPVLMELATFTRCRFGIWPSHELLAKRARCCIRTVQDALQAARKLGLLEWWHQRVRRAWRALRAVNRYELRLPAGAALPGPHGP